MSTVTARVAPFERQPTARPRGGEALWAFINRKPLGLASAALLVLLVTTAIFAGVLAPYDPLATQPEIRLAPPSRDHPFGTDDIGRDVLSRVVHGSRISLWVGVLAVGIGTVVGLDSEQHVPRLRGAGALACDLPGPREHPGVARFQSVRLYAAGRGGPSAPAGGLSAQACEQVPEGAVEVPSDSDPPDSGFHE